MFGLAPLIVIPGDILRRHLAGSAPVWAGEYSTRNPGLFCYIINLDPRVKPEGDKKGEMLQSSWRMTEKGEVKPDGNGVDGDFED